MRSSTLASRCWVRRCTVASRKSIHSLSIVRRLFGVGRPSQPTIVRLTGVLLSRLVCASSVVMQVHDELVLEVPDAELDWARAEIPRLMAGVAELKVPLLAEVGVGANWDQAH